MPSSHDSLSDPFNAGGGRTRRTPDDEMELVKELRDTARALRVKPRLRGWARALRSLPRRNVKGAQWLLLVQDLKANTLSVIGFADPQKARAPCANRAAARHFKGRF